MQKLLNLFVCSCSKWWQILQFCLLHSFGLQASKGGRKKKVVTFLLDFKWNDEVVFAILFNKHDFHSYGNLSYFAFACESLPHYKAQQYVIRFSLEFKSMMRWLQNSFQQSYIQIWKYFSWKSTPHESLYKLSHFFPFLLDSIKTKKWFLE